MPSVRGFLFKDLKQCLRKEHCDVSEIQFCNLFFTDFISVCIHAIVILFCFLFFCQNALRISSNVPGAKVLVLISKVFKFVYPTSNNCHEIC